MGRIQHSPGTSFIAIHMHTHESTCLRRYSRKKPAAAFYVVGTCILRIVVVGSTISCI